MGLPAPPGSAALEIKGNFFKPQSGQAQESVEITSRIFLIVHNKRWLLHKPHVSLCWLDRITVDRPSFTEVKSAVYKI
jgi:hypothetical protein